MKILRLKYSIVFLIFISFVSCNNDMEEIKAFLNSEDLPDVTIKNLHSKYSVNGRTQIVLTAPLAIKYFNPQKDYSVFPKGINIVFYDKQMNIHSSLSADYGIYYEKKNFAKASGNVILTNVNGSVLRTEELFLDEKEEKIYSVKPVNIKDKSGFEITGEGGFESNLDFTVYRFTDVSGKIIKEEDFTETGEKRNNKTDSEQDVPLK